MKKLKTMENVVFSVLTDRPEARTDDFLLMYYVCEKLCPIALQKLPLGMALLSHKEHKIPNWKSVERCRRRLQRKFPELVSKEIISKRSKEEMRYRAYSKV